jgi:hypothetical protein
MIRHETPSEEIFNEIKQAAIKVWKTKDNTGGYVTEKIAYLNSFSNYADNAMTFYRLFDSTNRMIMLKLLSGEALEYISKNL